MLPVDAEGRVLLLLGWDPAHPQLRYWFTIGGATEVGETLAEAAVRELHEEVGIAATPAMLGEPIAHRRIEFEHDGLRIVQDQAFFALAVTDPAISFSGQDEDERATIGDHGWWTPDDLAATGSAAHPSIPEIMRLAVRKVATGVVR